MHIRALSIRTLDVEVKHWSENVSDECLLDVVAALIKRVQHISRDYDIPYVAGYGKNGQIVFIDRHTPNLKAIAVAD